MEQESEFTKELEFLTVVRCISVLEELPITHPQQLRGIHAAIIAIKKEFRHIWV